jgi:hypothetical protein
MASASDFGNIPGMTRELRDGVASAFDTLSRWRDEIETVNERYVSKVLDQTSGVARSMGWPEEAVRATREYLEKISKTQTDMIDQIMETWKHQLTATTAPMSMPHSFTRQMTGATSAFSGAMPQFNPLEPWTFWFQAAEMWQRTWMPEFPQRGGRRH